MADALQGDPQAFLLSSWQCIKPTHHLTQKRSVERLQSPMKRDSCSAVLFTALFKHDFEASTFTLNTNNKHSVHVLVTELRSRVIEFNCYLDTEETQTVCCKQSICKRFTNLVDTEVISFHLLVHSAFTNNNKRTIFDVTQSLQFNYVQCKSLPTASTCFCMLIAAVTNSFEEEVGEC